MNGRAKRTGQSQRLVEAKLDLGLCQCPELLHVFLESAMGDGKLRGDVVEAAGSHQALQALEIALDVGGPLGMAFRIRLVPAQLKVLLRPARLQHFVGELPVEVGDGAGTTRNGPRRVGRPTADLIDRADRDKPNKADDANRQDPMGEPKMK